MVPPVPTTHKRRIEKEQWKPTVHKLWKPLSKRTNSEQVRTFSFFFGTVPHNNFLRGAKIFRQPYLLRQGRFAHLKDEDFDYFQSKIDEM
jgi:hypothetical protein